MTDKKFCRVSMTWLDADEYDRRYAEAEERAFQRKASQGQLCAPMIISDGQPSIMSMTNGKYYDSKSEMRREYKRAGVDEVGTDTLANRNRKTWAGEKEKRKKQRQGIKASLYKAHSRMGYGAP